MMSSGCKDDEGARTWIKLVQARDEQCHDFFVLFTTKEDTKEGSQSAVCLERYRGHEGLVSFKAESKFCSVLFRGFATVRAGCCLCPSGSAAYYELQVVRMGEITQWGFCTETFEPIKELSCKGAETEGVEDGMACKGEESEGSEDEVASEGAEHEGIGDDESS